MLRFATLVLALFAAAPGTARPIVLASIAPLHSLASLAAGEEADVQLLLRATGSAHSHQLRPSEARMIAHADLVLWIGPQLESYLARPIATLAPGRGFAMLDAANLVRLRTRAAGVHEHGPPAAPEEAVAGAAASTTGGVASIDPHVWLDPLNAAAIVEQAAALLARADPPNRERYRRNAAKAAERLRGLDAEIEQRLAVVRERPFVTVHDALAYFTRRYRLHSIGAIVATPERSPGAQTISRLRAAVRASGARCLLMEPGMRPALAQAIGGTELHRAVFDPLGARIAPGPDLYFELMRTNVAALVECLSR